MQYTIIVNQLKAVEWGLNAAQAALIAFVYELESWGDDVVQDDFAYKWISKQKVVDELPLYFSKPDTVHRNLIDLESKGLIVRNFTAKRSLVKLTNKGREWRITSDINPTLVGNKSYPTSDLNPTDPSTNIIEPDQSLKNTKKKGLDFSPLGLTNEQITEWKDLRAKAKASITQRVINIVGKEFEKSRQAGFTNDQILDLLSEKSWKSYKHEWMLNANQAMGAQAHGTQQRTKEHNGIGYGEHADQSIFPNYLQIATNDMPDIKATREAAQLTYLKTYGTQVLGSDGAALRASLENDEWQ
ncbi:hypothetical protein GL177_19355 [Vibrio toranzoniae]|uniref:hypothetical protein n=1 Tax=Vibrio toranzoniae TaxID=1194427 RepID=UPI001378C6A2|nr:hypothetical protein [Vibrio toranzoniae]NAZ55472.1 hypothetical protein [Vibrio toranzoniae]